MEPNVERYKVTRVAFSIGAVAALGLRLPRAPQPGR